MARQPVRLKQHDLVTSLCFDHRLHPDRKDGATKYFLEGKGSEFVFCGAERGDRLRLVFANATALLERGIFEEALVTAFTDTKHNNREWKIADLVTLFNKGDRDKLLTAGDPLPGKGPFVVYRGVAGSRPKIRSLSWSGSLDVACWFALRYTILGGKSPAVYEATLHANEVYFYDNGQNEEEFVGRPKTCRLYEIGNDEMQRRANLRTECSKKAHEERLAKI